MFDSTDWILKNILNEIGDQNQPMSMNPQQDQRNPGGEPGSAIEQQKAESGNVFADLKGKTIKGMNFMKSGVNAGKIEIYFAEYKLPLAISWVNDKVTVSKPQDGEVVALT